MIDKRPIAPEAPAAPAERSLSGPRLLPVVARVVLVLIGLAPWCVPWVHSTLPALGSVLDGPFVWVCHRMPARTLHIAGTLMPVCSRCAGIFAGLAAGAIVALPHRRIRFWRTMGAVAAAMMIVDIAMQDWAIHPVWHPSRIATGVFVGYVMAAAFVTNLAGRPGARLGQSPKAM